MEVTTEVQPEGFFVPSEEADCLRDVDTYKFYRTTDKGKRELDVPTRKAMVMTYYAATDHTEKSIINVAPVRVLLQGSVVEVMADVVTGTLYHKTGECLSSDKRRVTKWQTQ